MNPSDSASANSAAQAPSAPVLSRAAGSRTPSAATPALRLVRLPPQIRLQRQRRPPPRSSCPTLFSSAPHRETDAAASRPPPVAHRPAHTAGRFRTAPRNSRSLALIRRRAPAAVKAALQAAPYRPHLRSRARGQGACAVPQFHRSATCNVATDPAISDCTGKDIRQLPVITLRHTFSRPPTHQLPRSAPARRLRTPFQQYTTPASARYRACPPSPLNWKGSRPSPSGR